jgi:hypothetical protein
MLTSACRFVLCAGVLWLGVRSTAAVPPPEVLITTVSIVAAAAPTSIVVPPPPPIPVPPPPIAPDLAAPVVGATCARDLAHVGRPLEQALAPPAADASPIIAARIGTAVSRDGCVIAVWTTTALIASFDGGQTFAERLAAPGELSAVAVAAGRIVVVRDLARIGAARADGTTTWRELGDATPDAQLSLSIDGAWTVLSLGTRRGPLEASADAGGERRPPVRSLVAVSDDDGATWRFVEAPVAGDSASVRIVDGRIELDVYRASPDQADGGDPGAGWTERFVADPADPRWHRRRQDTRRWDHAIVDDKFWGCGGSAKLVALKGRRVVTIVGDQRSEVEPFQLVTGRAAAYVLLDGHLHRVEGTRLRDLGAAPAADDWRFELVGVDAAGHAIAFVGDRLVRRTGPDTWRVLVR